MANFDINSHYIEEANFSQVKFGEDGYLLEVELNESQQIARNRLKEVVKSDIGSYGIYCQGQYTFDGESLTIKGEKVVVDGEIINILDASLTGLGDGSKVYIQTWDKEVSYLDDLKLGGNEAGEEVVENNIKDPRVGVETSKRYVLSYKLSTTLDITKKCMELGEVSDGNFISSARSVGESAVTHISHDGTPIKVLNLGGTFFTPPQFATQQNFNLYERAVVQNGIVDSILNTRLDHITKTIQFDVTQKITLLFDVIVDNTNNSRLFEVSGICVQVTGDLFRVYDTFTGLVGEAHIINNGYNHLTGVFIYDNGNAILYLNGIPVTSLVTNRNISSIAINSGVNLHDIRIKSILLYNRILSPQEIAHNFQVLLQNPSISHIQATDSNHVVIQNGYNTEECASGLLNTMGQEFVVDAESGEIVIENAVEKSKLLGVEMQGQTIKNLGVLTDTYYSYNTWLHTDDYVKGLQLGKTYYMVVDIQEPTEHGYIHIRGEGNKYITDTLSVSISNKQGINILTQSLVANITQEQLNNYTDCRVMYYSDGTECRAKVLAFVETLEEAQKIKAFLQYGLNSTEATLSTNDTKYSFYEPTIEGSTVVQARAKNGTEWVDINADDERDITLFDYRLKSKDAKYEGMVSLGSVFGVSDSLDRDTKVITDNTKEIVFDGSEDWNQNTGATKENTLYFVFTPKIDAKIDTVPICNLLKGNIDLFTVDEEGVKVGGLKLIEIRILKSKLATQDVVGFKQWLQTNPITIRHQLATPITRQLTTEEFNAYDIHKKVICLNQVGDVSDSLVQDKDGNVTVERKYSRYVFTGNESIALDTTYPPTDTNYLRFRIATPLNIVANPKGNSNISEWVDAISTLTNSFAFGGAVSSSNLIHCVIEKSKLGTQDSSGMANWLKNNNIEIIVQTHLNVAYINHQATPFIPLSQQQINNCLVEVKVDSPVPPSYFSFTHYPSIKSVLNTLTMEELISLSDLSKPFIDYDNAETNLNPTNVGYLSGGFINIPFSLRNKAYVRTEQVKLYDDITLVLVSTTAKELTISKTTENLSLVNVDDNKFILRIPTTEEGVGTVFLTSNSSIGVGVMKGEEV